MAQSKRDNLCVCLFFNVAEDAHRFSGSLNHLCELLCHQTEWLGPEDTFPVREQTKSLLAELYDVERRDDFLKSMLGWTGALLRI